MDRPRLPQRAVLVGLIGATAAAAALYALMADALWRQQRAAVSARLQDDAGRIAGQVATRWDAFLQSEGSCRLPEPTLMAVWRPDGGAVCRSHHATYYDEGLLAALAPRAIADGSARERWHERDSRHGTVEVLARARPVRVGEALPAAVVVAAAVEPPAVALTALRWGLLAAWLAACGAVLGFAWLHVRAAHRQEAVLVAYLQRLADGGGVPETAGPGPPSLPGPLAEATAAAQARLEQLMQRLGEREAVLASMAEGVLAVAPDGRVLDLNAAAGRMFGLAPAAGRGRDLLEVVRNPELRRFLREAQASTAPVERELTLFGPEPRILTARATALRDARGGELGTLVVLGDVTHLRRLERMRQDFVANVSHELKTPITSIKGFVETLADGAVEDPATARRFLEIIARHAERLHAITEDLLSLSRVEQEAAGGALHTEEGALADVLRAAVGLCAARAEARDIRLRVDCDEGLRAHLNPQLVEQAVVNLVDNAVKYAPASTEVRVQGAREGRVVVVRVVDQGPGIPSEHLPRLFERFYRVDKARSRQGGGTGLGLAIVKHIAQAHGGRVAVESRLGEGSTFTVHLPDAGGEAAALGR